MSVIQLHSFTFDCFRPTLFSCNKSHTCEKDEVILILYFLVPSPPPPRPMVRLRDSRFPEICSWTWTCKSRNIDHVTLRPTSCSVLPTPSCPPRLQTSIYFTPPSPPDRYLSSNRTYADRLTCRPTLQAHTMLCRLQLQIACAIHSPPVGLSSGLYSLSPV